MNQHAIVLRAAGPTYEEGLACARYVDQASEGFHRFWMGKRVAHIIATAFPHHGHSYSFEHVTFAERDNRIVGMALAFTSAQHSQFSEEPLRDAAGYSAIRMRIVELFAARTFQVLGTIPESDFYLLAIAVDPELRGEGVGATLLNATEEKARESGASRLSLHVTAPNEGARRLYERFGMAIDDRFRKGKTGIYRMAKVL